MIEYTDTIYIPDKEYKAYRKALKYSLHEDTKPYDKDFRQVNKFINGKSIVLSFNYSPEKKKRSRVTIVLKDERNKGITREDLMFVDTSSDVWTIEGQGVRYSLTIASDKSKK